MRKVILISLAFFCTDTVAKTTEYHIDIERQGHLITQNGSIPGPTLTFTEGDEAVIHVTNHLSDTTSIHWHGILIPGEMDGVPGFNGFNGIKPGQTFTYRFPIRQAGTYWYHSHSGAQEQDGHYGALVIHPKQPESIQAERDYVVVLSDAICTRGEQVMANLKKSSEYYVSYRMTISDWLTRLRTYGSQDLQMWGQMRMLPTDLADVSDYTFLMNGFSPQQNWTGIFNKGERIRLRFINASAMSMYDVRVPGLKLNVIEADGQPVEPVTVDEFRFGVAETYDVIVTPSENKAYSIVAEPIDRTGFAVGTLAPHQGMQGSPPTQRPRAQLTMGDMPHAHMQMDAHSDHKMMASGWAQRGTPCDHRALTYQDLRYRGQQPQSAAPTREIEVKLRGNMERFIWTMNDKKFNEASPIYLKYGERLRIKFDNQTMMAHPMHLHGMFVQLENGQENIKQPNKHTVIIPPGKEVSVLLTANEPGEWAFHCHMLYHMLAGMMRKVTVGDTPHYEKSHVDLHGSGIFYKLDNEISFGRAKQASKQRWESRLWAGSDTHKLWGRFQGEILGGQTEQSEIWALYSRMIDRFWDFQLGLRYDAEPYAQSYAAFGFQGLAPHFIESFLHVFIGDDYHVSSRFEFEKHIPLTQQLVFKPTIEANIQFQNVPAQHLGKGLSTIEVRGQLRYYLCRFIAPYLEVQYEQKLGQTALFARQNQQRRDDVALFAGLWLFL